MIGALIGDIAGSIYEFSNYRHKDFELLADRCYFTDDSVMSLAVCDALLRTRPDFAGLDTQAVESMQRIGRPYPSCGYGGRFLSWMYSDHPEPYNSFGNGSAMRVSGCGWAAGSPAQAKQLAQAVTAVTHNHPEGLKGAEATAVAVYMARTGSSLQEIRAVMIRDYYPEIAAPDFTCDAIRPVYRFNETCQRTVPQALQAFFESTDFEDAVRTAVSLGGDSDTLAAITGGIAGAYYGVPAALRERACSFLDSGLLDILLEFESVFQARKEPA